MQRVCLAATWRCACAHRSTALPPSLSCTHALPLRAFAKELSDKTFTNLTGRENDEASRAKELGEELGGVLFADNVDEAKVRRGGGEGAGVRACVP